MGLGRVMVWAGYILKRWDGLFAYLGFVDPVVNIIGLVVV